MHALCVMVTPSYATPAFSIDMRSLLVDEGSQGLPQGDEISIPAVGGYHAPGTFQRRG